MPSQIHVAALTDIGRVRTNNEDIFGIDASHGLYVVCDGMGGAAGGEVASSLACNTLIESFASILASEKLFSPAAFQEKLATAIRNANSAVYRASRAPEHRGMGTTLVAAAISGSTALIANVGDSRAYLLQHGTWQQITSDHSYINELIRTGSIRPEDSDAPGLQRFASTITRAIGTSKDVKPDFFSIALTDGDIVLLVSDGLTRYLDSPDFDTLIDPTDLEASCQRLIDSAKKQGGIDNITCLLLRYVAPAESSAT